MAKLPEFITTTQLDGNKLESEKVYKQTIKWLNQKGAYDIDEMLVQRYAMTYGRWIQVQDQISAFGMLDEVNGQTVASPLIKMEEKYTEQLNLLYQQILQMIPNKNSTDWII